MPYIAETGTTGYSFDEGIDMAEARKHLKGKVALAGYVPTVEVMLNGSPDLVYQASLECLGNGVDILAPGCSLPQHTTMENVAAMMRAAEDWAASPEVRANVPEIIRSLKPKKNRANGGDARNEDDRAESALCSRVVPEFYLNAENTDVCMSKPIDSKAVVVFFALFASFAVNWEQRTISLPLPESLT